jgi:hypothetical protein
MRSVLNIFLIVFSISGYPQKSGEWKLSRNQDGVKVYMRKSEDSKLKEVLGIMQVKSSLGALVSIAKDTKNHHLWIYANKSAVILKSISDFEWIYYNISEAPWPVSNRDIITHAVLQQDKTTYKISVISEGVPGYIPPKKDLVRIPRLRNKWEFTPKDNGLIEVKFEMSIDLGGDIPAWLVNMAIDKGPLNTLINLKKLVDSGMHKNKKLSYIMEKPQ